jgi:broad specificity phosphatase PhoE
MSAVPFAILRHAATIWNEQGRLQGMIDTPLSSAGRADARSWRLPAPVDRWRRMSSPLCRARQTAELVRPASAIAADSRLREMSFGLWEGRTLVELRAEGGDSFAAAERLGLDFHPPGGESPRMTMARIGGWVADVAAAGEPVFAVSHKAVIRALLSLSTGWDMTGRQPIRLDWRCLHFFMAHRDGKVTLERPNVAMEAA